jgi:ATP-dependent RNA helicase SUPV3L1/SUV3
MSKKSKNLVSLNHLPGILLASAAECERWIEAGLIPVAERRTFQKRGRAFEAPMFDPEVVAQLAAEVPAWREQGGEILESAPHAPRSGGDHQPLDDAAHRRRQSVLAPVRRNTGIYVAEDIRRIESGRWKPERVFAG